MEKTAVTFFPWRACAQTAGASCFISLTTFPGTLNISGAEQTWFHAQLKLLHISKRDLAASPRSADKLPRFSFVLFGEHKSRWVIVRQLHCTITCLQRVPGSPSRHRTFSRRASPRSRQQKKKRKKSVAKAFAPMLLSIRAPCLASRDAFWGPRAESFLWRSNYQFVQHYLLCRVTDGSRIPWTQKMPHTSTCRVVIMMHVIASMRQNEQQAISPSKFPSTGLKTLRK